MTGMSLLAAAFLAAFSPEAVGFLLEAVARRRLVRVPAVLIEPVF